MDMSDFPKQAIDAIADQDEVIKDRGKRIAALEAELAEANRGITAHCFAKVITERDEAREQLAAKDAQITKLRGWIMNSCNYETRYWRNRQVEKLLADTAPEDKP